MDLQHLYIDGSRFEANANKYSWVWKKATEKPRYRLFGKITTLFEETTQQRHYEKLKEYAAKLEEYVEKIKICGEDRNSYSKTDHSATFMRIKTDYMGNDQLLPDYNVQAGVADEYIAVVDVNQYRSDMDCFIPLLTRNTMKIHFVQ